MKERVREGRGRGYIYVKIIAAYCIKIIKMNFKATYVTCLDIFKNVRKKISTGI